LRHDRSDEISIPLGGTVILERFKVCALEKPRPVAASEAAATSSKLERNRAGYADRKGFAERRRPACLGERGGEPGVAAEAIDH
jgi:hypothetical protein